MTRYVNMHRSRRLTLEQARALRVLCDVACLYAAAGIDHLTGMERMHFYRARRKLDRAIIATQKKGPR